MPQLQPISSITHAHLNYVLAAEFAAASGAKGRSAQPLRILDAGCGQAELILAFQRHLPGLTNVESVEVHGFDVSDSRVQKSTFFQDALEKLQAFEPDVEWSTRLHQIRSDEEWPFPDGYFDFVVSNQVLEHVQDLDHFLANVERVLKSGGRSINLFPTKSLVVEGHIGVPFAHRIASDDARTSYITAFAKAGLSRLGPMRLAPGQDVKEFGTTRSEYVGTQTRYRSFRELSQAGQRHGLVTSYRWTPQFFTTKLAYLSGRDPQSLYRRPSLAVVGETALFPMLSLVSSVTISFVKSGAYDPDDEHAGHLKPGE